MTTSLQRSARRQANEQVARGTRRLLRLMGLAALFGWLLLWLIQFLTGS